MTNKSNSMWGGRFQTSPHAIMEKINASIDFDKKMYAQDIAGSQVHAKMLADTGIITGDDYTAIAKGLGQIKAEIESGQLVFSTTLEDIHMNVESRLRECIGEAAGRLHTGRSRNDQVATDFRLWLRDGIDETVANVTTLLGNLIDQADKYHNVVMPGFTHLQTAQPVTFGHHLLAYAEMIGRDKSRLLDCRKRMNQCPLGAAALAGTSFPIDRQQTARELGFDGPTHNSMDSVAARDFALEYLSCAAILSVHLSRLAEEMVIWASAQFNYITLSDKFTTGSSIMPQKKNPDAAELVRAKPGRIMGALVALLTVMKGLPMTYGKDMQEDKEPTFDAVENLNIAILATAGMVDDMRPNAHVMRASLQSGFPTATDLADWLVRVLNMPFREAHHVTGRIVALAEEHSIDIAQLTLPQLQSVEPTITEGVFSVLDVDSSVNSRTSYGGTAPENVKQAVVNARKRLL